MSDRVKIILAYTAICTIWGSTWLAIKIGLETMTPMLSAGLRMALAGVILFAIIRIKKIPIPWNAESRWFYGIAALTSFSIPFALVYWGEHQISSGMTSILFATFPLWVAVMSGIFIPSEELTQYKIIGVLLGFTGVATIFSNDIQFDGNSLAWLGMGAVILSAAMQGFSAVFIKKHGHTISPFVVSCLPMSISAVLLLSASLFFEDTSGVQFTPLAIVSIFYLAIFGSIVTFVSYFWLLKRVEVVLLSLTAFITPLIAVFLGVLILNEQISTQLFVGATLVFLGIASAHLKEIRSLSRKYINRQ